MKYTRLGDLLVSAGAITQDQLNVALKEQKKAGQRLGEYLISSGTITERQLIDALTMQLGIEFVDLTSTDIDPEMTKLVPKSLARRYTIVPVRTRGDELYLAMADPLNFIAQEEAKSASKKRIVPMIATRRALDHAISDLYGTEGAKRAIQEMQKEGADNAYTLGVQANELDESAAPSIRLVDNIIDRGIADRASDIHIEPQEDGVRVRMRIDGILHEEFIIPKELQLSLTSRIKVMCGMDVTERRVPQDGRAIVRTRGKEVDLRVSTLPTVRGEKIVLRILDRDNKLNTAEELGFYGHNLEEYKRLLRNKQGVVLLVGPTGSGKSSTLYTMINLLNSEEVNVVTLEDPVEFNIEGVTQVQVNEKTGTTFAAGLRSILRQDPDIIVVGEIRDAETADIALRAAITGHLVLSTVHSNDAIATLDRLTDIGVAPYMTATALRGIIGQRLVRRICPRCKRQREATEEEREVLGAKPGEPCQVYYGAGCPDCFNTGYRGRTVVSEVLTLDRQLAQLVHDRGEYSEVYNLARRKGYTTMHENAVDLVRRGVTTVDEVLRTTYSTD